MLDKSQIVPRKDPLRASRIFVLASQSMLLDGRLPDHTFEHQRDRAGRLLINALECLLLAQSERAVGAQMWAQAQPHPAAHFPLSTRVRFGSPADDPHAAAREPSAELSSAIHTLTDAVAALREGDPISVEHFTQLLGAVARSLSSEESN